MNVIVHRVSPQAARYIPGGGREKCGLCRFFAAPRSCGKVIGPVSPMGWCKHYSRQMVSQFGGSQATGFGPSLMLDFLNPGNIPAGVTFTRASTATYTNSAGVIQAAAINAPRWDYASGVLRGLLIEEQRTNLLTASVPTAGAPWSLVGSTAQGGSVVAPDGTTATTSLISATTTASDIRAVVYLAAVSASAATAYTVSAFLKKSQANAYIQVNIGGGATVVPCAYFDLTNGTALVGADLVAGAANKSVTITPYPNGWYRVTFTFTTQAGASNMTPYIGPCAVVSATGDNRSYTGIVGQGVYVWGAQIEQGAFATSYIPTTVAAATRSPDLAAMPLTPAASGTYQAEFISNGVAAGLPVILSGNAGSPVMSIGADSRLVATIKGGAAVFSGVAPAMTFNAVNKSAFGYITGGSKAAVNGTTLGANAVALTVTGTTVQFGSDGVTPGNNSINGTLRRVNYWPRVLSDAEMQQVTT